ncbi:hypothetical protein M2150_001532 [Lachnospiraceae bacterium PM6-15]|uniref:hypothetical protein n=1 Tax=Ohessyouella blattaphilus TaxID=2949333 RepID=UPI003E322CD0
MPEPELNPHNPSAVNRAIKVVGHTDVSTTMNYYAEVNENTTKEWHEKLAKNIDVFLGRVLIKGDFQKGQHFRTKDIKRTSKCHENGNKYE